MTHTHEKALRPAQRVGKPASHFAAPRPVRDPAASVRSTDPARTAVVLAAASADAASSNFLRSGRATRDNPSNSDARAKPGRSLSEPFAGPARDFP